MTHAIRPLHDWHRHHPTAQRIARELLAHRHALNLRTRTLAGDVRQRFGIATCTAMRAIAIARHSAGVGQ